MAGEAGSEIPVEIKPLKSMALLLFFFLRGGDRYWWSLSQSERLVPIFHCVEKSLRSSDRVEKMRVHYSVTEGGEDHRIEKTSVEKGVASTSGDFFFQRQR